EKPAVAGHSLDRAERVLDGASPAPHQARIGVDARLHAMQGTLVDEPMDRPLRARRTPRLQAARLAGRRTIADRPVARVFARAVHVVAAGTADCVALLVVDELRWPE